MKRVEPMKPSKRVCISKLEVFAGTDSTGMTHFKFRVWANGEELGFYQCHPHCHMTSMWDQMWERAEYEMRHFIEEKFKKEDL